MANGLGGAVLPQIQRIFHAGTLAGLTDGQLLERFAARNDQAAFEALLARYGPLVLTVCRNLLRDRDDVEDAFQATLLVLVRKAGTIQLEASLGPWIYSVAYRVAIRARANRTLRIRRENAVADLPPQAPAGDLDGHDVAPLLHDELARLPERLRAPIVLCYFQGLTHELAAAQLGWPVGTVRSRMARARRLLRERLTRKGVALSAGFLVAASRQTTAAMIPRILSEETIQAAIRIAAGRAAISGALSAPVAALMEGVLSAMWLSKLKAATAVALLPGFVLASLVALAAQPPSNEAGPATPANLRQTEQADSDRDKSPPKLVLNADTSTPSILGLEALLARWEKNGGARTLNVTFSRTDKSPKRYKETYEGKFLMKSPDHSFIATDQVKGQSKLPHESLMRSGERLYQYRHSSKQVLVVDKPRGMKDGPRESLVMLGVRAWLNARLADTLSTFLSDESFPFLFSMHVAEIKRDFTIKLLEETANSAVIRFTPRNPTKDNWIQHVFVDFDKIQSLPRVVVIIEPETRTTKTFRFLSVTRDGPVDDSHFEFKPLEGWKVIKKDDEVNRDEQGLMRNAVDAFSQWGGIHSWAEVSTRVLYSLESLGAVRR
ncbi:RNA polymerase sigma factor, sigma-70 family [Singulisphaera sp. GP187]|uniref:sigma-70 family RNA polymerase sigma factor n=1 Tax=Singulisphaera sp. GP187 TaxID=1882752 RepID=UPI00092A71A7|nr:sigma-70 family RNA polymerase sigma factor [Singulisphaera sp. GP187]SIO58708.1 RNA polymerase sigma factor, sigma-70 family [Singulisphaera sp. GP187]